MFRLALCLPLVVIASCAAAGPVEDCNNSRDMDLRIKGCTQFIQQSKDPKQTAVGYIQRGEGYNAKKDYDRAITDYTTAIAKGGVDGYFKRANAYFSKKDYDRAIADYTSAIGKNAKNADAYYNRGNTYYVKKDYDRAVADYSKALPLLPADLKGRAVRLRWISNINLKHNSPALDDLLTLAKDYPAVLLSDDSAKVYGTLREAGNDKRDAEAVEVMRALKRAEYRGEDPRQLYEGFDSAMIDPLARLGRSDDIAALIPDLKRYETFLKLRVDRRYADLRSRPGVAALLEPQDFAARQLAVAQRAAARYPKYLDAQSGLIRALHLNGRYAEAISLGQSILSNLIAYEKDTTNEAWLRNALADTLVAHGKFDAANQVLQPLVSLDVKENSFVVSQWINFGGMLLWQGRFQDAIDMARKAKGYSSVYG
jgi:tetratricopeptide (TPR) repeat protein